MREGVLCKETHGSLLRLAPCVVIMRSETDRGGSELHVRSRGVAAALV